MSALPPPPPAGAANEPRSWLSSRLVARSDQLVRDVVSEFTRLGARIPEETITALRICVGRALRDSALWARRYQFTLDQGAKSDVLRHRLPKVMVRGQPTSTTRDDPAWESEASTEPFHRER